MKGIILCLFFAGVIFVVIGYINQLRQCPPPKVEYRYIPRTFDEEQNDQVKVSQLFRNLFELPSPWLAGYRLGYIRPNIYKINRFNISQ